MQEFDKIGEDLFNKIRGRFPSITIGNEAGEVINEPSQARFFDFEYKESDKVLGNVSVNITQDEGMTIIYSKDFITDEDSMTKDHWYNFLKELRLFAKKRMMEFSIRDITKSNLTKRDYKFLSNRTGDNTMAESKLYGTSRMSYQDVDGARLIIKHTESVNQEQATGRTRNVGAIYIESSEGERFKYPYKHLNGARAMARHVAEGGNAYDDFGKHIVSLSEEQAKLSKFKRYMGRSAVMAESLAEYTDAVNERIVTVKKTLENLQKKAYYAETFESFTPIVMEDVPSDVAENWIDQLTIRQFNEELKDIFPYVFKLVSEVTKAKEMGPDELVAEQDCWNGYKKDGTQKGTGKNKGKRVNKCTPEEIALEQGFEEMMGQFSEEAVDENFMDTIKQLVPGAKGKSAKKSENAEQVKVAAEIDRKFKLVDDLMQKVRPLGGNLGKLMAFRRLPMAKMSPKGMYLALNDWYHSIEDDIDNNSALNKKYASSVEKLYDLWEEVGFRLSDYMWASGYNVKGIGQMAKIGFSAKKRTDPEWLKMEEAVDEKVCKDCGDAFDKPTTDCKHDSHDPKGSNWVDANNNGIGDMDEDDVDEAYINNAKDAVDVLGALRGKGKKIERGQDDDQGNLANAYASDVWDVYTWLQNKTNDFRGMDKNQKEAINAMMNLRGVAKRLETEPGSGSNGQFGNQIVTVLYPVMELIDSLNLKDDDNTMDVKIDKHGSMSKDDGKAEKEQKTPLGEFILSYFDKETGQFPKGETAVLTMIEKDYGEQFIEPAKAFIEQINSKFEEFQMRSQPQQMEAGADFDRIRELAGLR